MRTADYKCEVKNFIILDLLRRRLSATCAIGANFTFATAKTSLPKATSLRHSRNFTLQSSIRAARERGEAATPQEIIGFLGDPNAAQNEAQRKNPAGAKNTSSGFIEGGRDEADSPPKNRSFFWGPRDKKPRRSNKPSQASAENGAGTRRNEKIPQARTLCT